MIRSNLILRLDDSERCIECGDPSVVAYGMWVPSKHTCNCPDCKNNDEEVDHVYYCPDCTITLGLAIPSREAAAQCGYAPQGLEVLCASKKVKSFKARGEWWVLVTAVLSDESREL